MGALVLVGRQPISSAVEGVRGLSEVSHKGAHPIREGCTLIPGHLPAAPPPNTAKPGVRLQCVNLAVGGSGPHALVSKTLPPIPAGRLPPTRLPFSRRLCSVEGPAFCGVLGSNLSLLRDRDLASCPHALIEAATLRPWCR